MNESRKHRWVFLLIGIAWLLGTNAVLAESKSEASKRAFAALVARKAEVAARRAERATADARRAARQPAVPSHDPQPVLVRPYSPPSPYGVSAATPVVPPSGYGRPRDIYIEILYDQILGRGPTQSELDYWVRVLVQGIAPNIVARSIWDSLEHESLIASGQAPGIPLGQAYLNAQAAGRKVKYP